MKRLFRHSQSPNLSSHHGRQRPTRVSTGTRLGLLLLCSVLVVGLVITTNVVVAQSDSSLQEQEDQLIREYTLPTTPQKEPVYKPAPASPPKKSTSPRRKRTTPAPSQPAQSQPSRSAPASTEPAEPAPARRSPAPSSPAREEETAEAEPLPTGEYVLQFNRSPIVGNRFRFRGVYSEARLGFTRPRGWKIQGAKALIRFQHSPALIAKDSNLTVRINGTSVGSVPLNRQQSEVGSVLFNVPSRLIQDYNELTIVARQSNDEECSDPGDPTLWTEVLPDSELQFEYQPQPIPLNFSRYPYPFFDDLSLDTNRIAYLLPKVNDTWLTAAPRFQAALGRMAEFRPIDTEIVNDLEDVEWGQRLVVIGTPAEQPGLADLDLPFSISGNQILDGNQVPLPADVGILMMTTTLDGGVPVLVVTGNGADGVAKAAQFLVQPDSRKFGTGQAVLVDSLKPIDTPSLRNWPGYLPEKNSFTLSEIKTKENGDPFQDITVRGSAAPPILINFHALPDDQFSRGSSMTLRYSYSPQINPRTSAIEVLLDGTFIGGARLTSEDGASRKRLKVDLPPHLIKPDSQLEVAFRLNPREPGVCGKVTDQQLTGTLHADTSFNLNRQQSVQLPDLELFQDGYPFAAPQDLSRTAIVVPDSPSNTDLLTLLTVSERLGRLSKADSVNLDAYTITTLPAEVREGHHLVGIGTREQFPFPEVFDSSGFRLQDAFSRQWNQGSIQALPDNEGMIKEIMSPDNKERVLLALTAQTANGLEQVRQVIRRDPWFFQLQEDTILISSNQQDPASYDPDAYTLEFLERAPSTRRIENTGLLSKVSRFIQDNWFFLPAGIFAIALLLYGISQFYLKRLSDQKSH
ncbi:MAG: cellulose biosynthesis cyclic di-GMP-binding regulatory protein BcsB [Coleofasciculus sp. C1-SOL-03]|uniref:cellulose biosynthesis cyclic di-GMP-binding regulatory protein BcsB n=1 Tax=Coleofasciculus sp. C1-SOL-03 TaxID=3069522 RepID=UPI003304B6E0